MEIKIKRNSDEDSTLSQPAAPQPGTPPVSAPQPGRMKIGLKKTEPPPVPASAPAPEAAPAAAPAPASAPAAKPGMARINLKPKKETPAPAPVTPVAPVAPVAPSATAKTPEPSSPPKKPAAPDRPPKKEKPEKAEANQATPKDRKSIGGLVLKVAVGLMILGVAGGLGWLGWKYYPAILEKCKTMTKPAAAASSATPAAELATGEENPKTPPPPPPSDVCPICSKQFPYQASAETRTQILEIFAKIGTMATLDDVAGFKIQSEKRSREEVEQEIAAAIDAEVNRRAAEMFRLYKVGDTIRAKRVKEGIVYKGPIVEIEPLENIRDASIYGIQISDSQNGLTKILYRQMERDVRAHFKPYSAQYRAKYLDPNGGKLYARERRELKDEIERRLFRAANFNEYEKKFHTRSELETLLKPKLDPLCHQRFAAAAQAAGFTLDENMWYSADEWKKIQAKRAKAKPASDSAPAAAAPAAPAAPAKK